MDKYGQLSSSSYFAITVTSIILLLVYLSPGFFDMDTLASKLILSVIIALFTILSLTGLYYYPLSITVDIENLYINYMIHSRTIPISKIDSASLYDGPKRFVPIFGSYGFFGWWGLYKNSSIGKFQINASNLDELVVIRLKNGKILVLSCNDSEELARQINRRLNF